MNKLAVELITLISQYACTDGGKTARFHSVSLIRSPEQIAHFIRCYQNEVARSRDTTPRVRHLCLSFFGSGIKTAPQIHSPEQEAPKSRAEFLAAQQRRSQFWRSAQLSMDEQYNKLIPELFRAIAPHLETLALIQTQWRCSTFLDCQFPRLQELTLIGGDPSFLPFHRVRGDRPVYPALLRLHHVPSLVNREIDFNQWARHAPNLTHLRVSRMGAYPEVTVNSLIAIMSPSAPAHVFPHLENIVIQPLAAPIPGSDAPPTAIARSFNELCARLREAMENPRAPTLLLVPKVIPHDNRHRDITIGCVYRMELEWMTRIEGGEGCWDAMIGDGPLDGCWSTPAG